MELPENCGSAKTQEQVCTAHGFISGSHFFSTVSLMAGAFHQQHKKRLAFPSHSGILRHIFLDALSYHPGELCSIRHTCAPCCGCHHTSDPDKVPLHSSI